MEKCSCCFTDYIAKCEEGIKLNIILPVYASYRWVITDKFHNKYQGELAPDLIIPVADLPPGFLTQFSGMMTLEIFESGNESCGPVQFLVAGRYDCIEFTVSGGTFEKSNLGCEIEQELNEPLSYIAFMIQQGTNDPVVDVQVVNSIGGIVWTRNTTGVYMGALTGAFPFAKTVWNSGIVPGVGSYTLVRLDDNSIGLYTYNTLGVAADGILSDSVVSIQVYP